jgi:hypothetical protein
VMSLPLGQLRMALPQSRTWQHHSMLGSEHTRGLAALDRRSGACAAAVWFAHGSCIGELEVT